MPDWSYQTILKPALFRMKAAASRDLTLSRIGWLARTRFGQPFIDLLGHMSPPRELATTTGGIDVDSPVGLGPFIDPAGVATSAFARFGFGFVEIGPLSLEAADIDDVERLSQSAGIALPEMPASAAVDVVEANLGRVQIHTPIGLRLAHRPGASPFLAAHERLEILGRLGARVDFVTLDMVETVEWPIDEWREHLKVIKAVKAPVWISFAPDVNVEELAGHIDAAIDIGVEAVVVSGGVLAPQSGRSEKSRRVIGAPEREATLKTVAAIRSRWGGRVAVVAGGGIVEPGDAIRAIEAGASMVQIDAGLVFSGPGLPKRTNEAILACRNPKPSVAPKSWIWLLFLGLSMILGGLLATVIAITRVVLPYDESFIGMSAAGIRHVNRHLLAFMTHDRITLAGTMMSIGVLYTGMAAYGVRRGARWAWTAIMRSSTIGFASFFLFLGFGYFDPLHAVVSAILFVFFLMAFRERPRGKGLLTADLVNDVAWRRSLVGQLLFITIGIGLILAGVTICGVGITRVFIPTDLMFLHTTRETVVSANAHLLPLIAHDRAGFGGTLWSDGIAVLLLSLWGFRRGASWVWWTLLLGGLPGFIAALGVHMAIGYMHFHHLFPVYLSSAMFAAGLTLSREYLCGSARGRTR